MYNLKRRRCWSCHEWMWISEDDMAGNITPASLRGKYCDSCRGIHRNAEPIPDKALAHDLKYNGSWDTGSATKD